jgi:hypothetical protein
MIGARSQRRRSDRAIGRWPLCRPSQGATTIPPEFADEPLASNHPQRSVAAERRVPLCHKRRPNRARQRTPGIAQNRACAASARRDCFRPPAGADRAIAMATERSSVSDPLGVGAGRSPLSASRARALGQAGDCFAHDSERQASVLETAPCRRPKEQAAAGHEAASKVLPMRGSSNRVLSSSSRSRFAVRIGIRVTRSRAGCT